MSLGRRDGAGVRHEDEAAAGVCHDGMCLVGSRRALGWPLAQPAVLADAVDRHLRSDVVRGEEVTPRGVPGRSPPLLYKLYGDYLGDHPRQPVRSLR
jgi:hypothetical protein